MLPLVLGSGFFAVLMAGLFAPLEAFAGTGRFSRRDSTALPLALVLLVTNTVLMQLLGGRVLEALAELSPVAPSAAVGRAVAVFVLSDFLGYWLHRAMHRVPWVWRFHRLHHEATDDSMAWFDAWRMHPVDFVLHGVVVGIPGALCGVTAFELASVIVLRKAFTTFLHADLSWDFGPALASPAFHRRHHSADPREFDSHFAAFFPVWDVLFGTWRNGSADQRSPSNRSAPETIK